MKIACFQNVIDRLRGKKTLKIYPPYYNERIPLKPEYPDVYNTAGRKIEMFFLRDRHFSTAPYGTFPTRFLWDRFNYGLDTHFYTGKSACETMGTPKRRYAWLLEPRIKQPRDYERFEKDKALAKEFDFVLTYDEKLLDGLDNAFFFPGCAFSWVAESDADIWRRKTENVSILSSRKKMCPLHCLRIALAQKCKREGLADAFGTFDGGKPVPMAETLIPYRYTIAVENQVSDYFYTERLISAFITMTVPIYIGARKIGQAFNTDGIIQISPDDGEHIESVLKQCGEQDYLSRLPALRENYRKALSYMNLHDLLYDCLFVNPADRTLFTGFEKVFGQ